MCLKRSEISASFQCAEDYVSFEIAKLLKEKGFDEECSFAFYKDGTIVGRYDSEFSYNYYDRPTLQMAMKWLRKVHNLHIMVDCIGAENYIPTIQFTRNGKDIEIKSKISKVGGNGFNSNEQAIDAAIKYCLENLI